MQPNRRALLPALVILVAGAAAVPARSASTLPVETLRPVAALPAHIVTAFREQTSFVAARSGVYLGLDRRAHTVFAIDGSGTARPLLGIGHEPGRVLQPAVLAISRDDIFAVLDAPNDLQRIQYFDLNGRRIGGFYLPVQGTPRIVIGDAIVSGVGAMTFTGETFLVAEPAWGSLFAELDTAGTVLRHVGQLRPTGYESDAQVHLALNTGVPLVDPTGGFYFVFQTGRPLLRKYDRAGRLLFERHIEGPELDARVQALPTTWAGRMAGRRPLVPPLVRAAGVDRLGRVWVSLIDPFTYVYDPGGDKLRVVQFRGTEAIAASQLFFKADGRVLVTPGGYEFATGSSRPD